VTAVSVDRSPDVSPRRSRRALLAGTFGGLVALGAQAIRPLSAHAEGEVIHVGDNLFTSKTATWLKNTTTDNDVFRAQTTKAGRGVYGLSATGVGVEGASTGRGAGVYGRNNSGGGAGVFGKNSASGEGVRGESAGGHGVHGVSLGLGFGVYGESAGTGVLGGGEDTGVFGGSNDGTGVWGSSGSGRGVIGSSAESTGIYGKSNGDVAILGISYASGYPSVRGFKDRPGAAVVGEIQLSTSDSPAVSGKTSGTGQGVLGQSAQGRGGVFGSPVAQVRLLPAIAGTHPIEGAKGDLSVDTSCRLWFCKGGATWVQLA
jgi:hypothetical protein